jgi:hypothetical protein
MYRVRCTNPPGTRSGTRFFITANGYRDAIKLQKKFGGKIIGKPRFKKWR